MAVRQEAPVRVDRNFWIVTVVLALLSVAAVIYWMNAPVSQWLAASSDSAQQVDVLFRFMAASGSTVMIYVLGYLLYFVMAFGAKKSDGPDAIGIQIHDNHTIEFWWTLIPAIFVVVLSIISVRIWFGIQLQPSNGLVIEAIGHQWYYSFRAPGVNGEIPNEVHVPVGKQVTVDVTSTDVIHSFWVPQFRVKADMVPGLVNTIRFTPTEIGRYQIICTEFCGTQHGIMNKQYFVVDPPDKFAAWLKSWQIKNATVSDALPKAGSGGPLDFSKGVAATGQTLFAQKCSSCHAIAPFDHKIVGPGLKGLLSDPKHPNLVDGAPANAADIATILQKGYSGPIGMMPNQAANGLSDTDIANLVAYLASLK